MSLGVRYGQMNECQDALFGSFPLTGICPLLSPKHWWWGGGGRGGLPWEDSRVEPLDTWPWCCSVNSEDANGTPSHLLPETSLSAHVWYSCISSCRRFYLPRFQYWRLFCGTGFRRSSSFWIFWTKVGGPSSCLTYSSSCVVLLLDFPPWSQWLVHHQVGFQGRGRISSESPGSRPG